MQISFEQAMSIINGNKNVFQSPALSPAYIVADAKRDPDLEPVFVSYQESDQVFLYGFHVAPVMDTGYYDIQSPYGFGGPIYSTDERNFQNKAWSKYLAWCKDNKILAEFVRFHPLENNWVLYKGEVAEDRDTVWIDLEKNADLISSYSCRSRTAVRKAILNGLSVEWFQGIDEASTFRGLYEEIMKQLNADKFYFFSESYFNSILSWENSYLALCKYEDEVVAGGIFLKGPMVMEYHLSAANLLGKKLNATNLLIHEAAILAKQLRCKALHLGGGTNKDSNNSLLSFKAGFSMCRSTYRIGWFIHNKDFYEEIKLRYQSEGRPISNRILFYR